MSPSRPRSGRPLRQARRARARARLHAIGAAIAVLAASPAPCAWAADFGAAPQDPGSATVRGRGARIAPEIPVLRDVAHDGGGAASTLRLAIPVGLLLLGGAVAVGLRRRHRSRSPRGVGALRLPWSSSPSSGAAVAVGQSVRLTAQASVHVVTWRDTEWLIACAEGGITILGRAGDGGVADPAGPAATPEVPVGLGAAARERAS